MSLDPVERLHKSDEKLLVIFLNNHSRPGFSFLLCEKNWCPFTSTNKKPYLFLGEDNFTYLEDPRYI